MGKWRGERAIESEEGGIGGKRLYSAMESKSGSRLPVHLLTPSAL